VMVGMKKRIKL